MTIEVSKSEHFQHLKVGKPRHETEMLPFGNGDKEDKLLPCVHADELNALINVEVDENGTEHKCAVIAMGLEQAGIFGTFGADEIREIAAAFIKMAEDMEK